MASGDFTFFNEFLEDEGQGVHSLSTDTLKIALTQATGTTPFATTTDPRWGSGGSTNFAAEEVVAGGNYVATGASISNTFSESGGTATLDGDDVTWSQNAANPTNARWGIVYHNVSSGKEAVGFVDLGQTVDMSSNNLTITWNGSGIGTKTAS
jgi:hypothetical protein